MMTQKALLAATVLTFAANISAKEYYTKSLEFPADATVEQKIDMASRLVPSPKQLAWQDLEMTAFLHFGVNTFTGREWGDGSEDPAIFNPSRLDADQWVKTLKDAGFGLVILTAKHHDGFCLWPTRTTKHSVASSPWRQGRGDVMAELRRACDRYGMKLGVYLSPWDRNAPCYGDSPAYNDMFVEQLTELLTGYGRIDEVWFDGACGGGPNGKKQEYDWQRYKKTIETLQPDAVVAIMGDDVRWVGNEKGMGRETEWSATALTPGIYPEANASNSRLGIFGKAPDLGSRQIVAKAEKLYWWPSEVDVSIRPGWFYHEREQPKPLRQLVEIYLNSVGRNSVLLLNIPPDRNGLIADADVARLAELRKWLDANFSHNLASKPKGLCVKIKDKKPVNTIVLGEDISKGQHVEAFTVDALIDGKWSQICAGTTIGRKRILTFPEVRDAKELRLNIASCRGKANIKTLEAYNITLPVEVNATLSGYRTVPPTDWSVVSASGPVADAYRIFDDSDMLFWQSPATKGEKQITVDMKQTRPIAGFTYALRGDGKLDGTVLHYRFETSRDGIEWTVATTPGEFSNIMHNPIEQKVYFPTVLEARYFRFTAIDEIDGRDFVTVGEIRILTPDSARAPKDNETSLYKDPSLKLAKGAPHPGAKGWKFHVSHEFDAPHGTVGLPEGWVPQNGAHVARNARIDNDCYISRGGYLRMESHLLPDSVDNTHGRMVKHATYACRTAPKGTGGHWCDFTENMRIEVRARRSSTVGINDALWFMGNNSRPWPDNGEIDLLENPKKEVNDRAHFTLHSKNHHAGVVGGKGSTTATLDLDDMTDWNIYWLEWLPETIRGGVNGHTFFVHNKGDNGNTDWPWSDPEAFFMLMTSGLSTNPSAWPGAVKSEEWDPYNPPHMDVDWIRVFINDDYTAR